MHAIVVYVVQKLIDEIGGQSVILVPFATSRGRVDLS